MSDSCSLYCFLFETNQNDYRLCKIGIAKDPESRIKTWGRQLRTVVEPYTIHTFENRKICRSIESILLYESLDLKVKSTYYDTKSRRIRVCTETRYWCDRLESLLNNSNTKLIEMYKNRRYPTQC